MYIQKKNKKQQQQNKKQTNKTKTLVYIQGNAEEYALMYGKDNTDVARLFFCHLDY